MGRRTFNRGAYEDIVSAVGEMVRLGVNWRMEGVGGADEQIHLVWGEEAAKTRPISSQDIKVNVLHSRGFNEDPTTHRPQPPPPPMQRDPRYYSDERYGPSRAYRGYREDGTP